MFQETIIRILNGEKLEDIINKRIPEITEIGKRKREYFFKYKENEDWQSIKILETKFANHIQVATIHLMYKENPPLPFEIYLDYYKVFVKVDIRENYGKRKKITMG